MPIYEYACNDCHHVFEHLASTAASKRKPKCPTCGSGEVEKKLSTFAAHDGFSAKPVGCPNLGPSCGGCCANEGLCPMD